VGKRTTKPPIVGKRIPTLTLGRDNIGHAARLMGFYRLRALPVIEFHHGEIVGQISHWCTLLDRGRQ